MTVSRYISSIIILFFGFTALQAQTSATGSQTASGIPLKAEDVNPLEEGSEIPPIRLTTPEGEPFDLNAFVQEQPVVLVFYRGGWCPYCNIHLSELMDADSALRALGYEILAVSPDKPQKLAESVEKHQMNYRLLSDSDMSAAKALGVAFKMEETAVNKYRDEYGIDLEGASGEKHHLLPVPSVFIIDREGTLRYVYYNPNIKDRLDAETLMNKAKKAL